MWIEGSIPSFSYSYIIHYITTILYSTPHIHKPTHIYSPDPNKNHITISLYNISVSILHSYKPNYIFISYHTHHYLSYQDIYYLTYYSSPSLLIIYIYYTNLQSKYTLSKIDIYLYIYISYIHNYYSLTYTTQLLLTYLPLKYRTHLSIHLFHPTIVFIHIHTLTFIYYIYKYTLYLYIYLPVLLHHYFFINIVNIHMSMYIHTYIHTYND